MPEINYPVDVSNYKEIISNNPQEKSEDWGLSCYDELKRHIKRHYSDLQEDICFYCKISLNYGGYLEPLEHIVPKVDRPKWMFEPRNLALSCSPCNTKKNAKNTLTVRGLASGVYPSNRDDFLIFHPHFDNWRTHFEVFYEIFIRPKTTKGRATFEVSRLYRIDLPLNKAKRKDLEGETLRARVLEKVFCDPSAPTEIIDQCKEISLEIIRRAKNRKEIMAAKK